MLLFNAPAGAVNNKNLCVLRVLCGENSFDFVFSWASASGRLQTPVVLPIASFRGTNYTAPYNENTKNLNA
ncbi:MAG: hypothetical protein IMF15_01935 [Proteobacteria bacterium]|nr:hypothetical protein [Pseudomonadota bacterium]